MTLLLVPFVLTMACAFVLIAISFVAASSGRALRSGEEPPSKDEMKKHLVWGLIYSNPDDPRGWVPKIRGWGWTVNVRSEPMARAMAWITIATIVSVMLTVLGSFSVVATAASSPRKDGLR
jgi:uncharacterized membrane protein